MRISPDSTNSPSAGAPAPGGADARNVEQLGRDGALRPPLAIVGQAEAVRYALIMAEQLAEKPMGEVFQTLGFWAAAL